VNTKKCLGDAQHLLINSPYHPFCVEISLRTSEGETIPLETWCISFDDSVSDPTQRVRFNIYNRMSIVLRSLLTCTRATPTYQLSRKQSAQKYIICYKMYSGEPIVSHLGEHYSKKTIGNILTPIGRFVLNVAYRTSLAIVSTPVDNGAAVGLKQFGLVIKDNHFGADRSIDQ
jgi:autophagy-related protein 13